jgi:hypothetical protein
MRCAIKPLAILLATLSLQSVCYAKTDRLARLAQSCESGLPSFAPELCFRDGRRVFCNEGPRGVIIDFTGGDCSVAEMGLSYAK